MYVILEHNGDYIMGLMLKENGEKESFITEEEAKNFAIKNCAFEYKIIEL